MFELEILVTTLVGAIALGQRWLWDGIFVVKPNHPRENAGIGQLTCLVQDGLTRNPTDTAI